jgi:PAS domain-containing protein
LVRVRSADPRETDPADTTRTLTLLVDRMSDGVVVTDSGGRIVVANPAFLRLADAGAEDAVRGRPLGDWLGRIDADVTALLVGAHEHGVVHLVCSCLRRAGGELIDVDVTAAMLAEGEQERFGFTLRSRTTRGEPHAAWVQALATLDDSLGKLPLDELMARSKNLLERRFMSTAMQRTRGDAKAAAGLLGISEEQLLQSLGRDAATPDPSRSRPN